MEKLMKRMDDMGDDERKKLRKLLQEKDKESQDKMDWMYKKDAPDTEEYLLGRRIDKHIEEAEHNEEDTNKDTPGASFQEVLAKRADLDMQAKMREDPLYAIRQREEEARRRLLENPIKMKMLKKELKKRKKKEKKKKKSRGEDSDDELMAKYLAIVQQKSGKGGVNEMRDKLAGKKGKKKTRHDSSDSDDSDESESEEEKKKPKHHSREQSRNSAEQIRRDRPRNQDRDSPGGYSRQTDRQSEGRAYKDGHSRDYRNDDYGDRRKNRDVQRHDRDTQYPRDKSRSSDRHRHRSEHSEGSRSGDFANGSHGRDKPRNPRKHRDSSTESSSPRRPGNSRQSRRSESPERSHARYHKNMHKNESNSKHKDGPGKHHNRRSESSSSSDEDRRAQVKKRRHDSGTSDSQSSSENEDKKPRKQYGLILSESHVRRKREPPSPQKVETKPTKSIVQPRQKSPPRKKLSAEEMARRRDEMMGNAKWRDKERERNVRRYNAEDAAEKAQLEKQKQRDSADFINPLMASHASQSSVEDRIKRNRYNVQRVKGDREAGFAKK